MVDAQFDDKIINFPINETPGSKARNAAAQLENLQKSREGDRARRRENAAAFVKEKEVNLDMLGLTSEQKNVFYDAITDAQVVEDTGRTDTEKVNKNLDPLAIRYEFWFRKANIIESERLLSVLRAVHQVVPSVIVGKLVGESPKR